MNVKEKRKIGRPKKRQCDGIESHIKSAGVSKEDAGDWVEWKLKTRVIDSY